MIAHLRGREAALEPFGWTGRQAEWIALVCLHSGVFTRTQATRFLDTHHERARRLVHALIAQGLAAEETVPGVRGIGRVCRIYSDIVVSPCHYSTYRYTPIYCPLITPLFLNGTPSDPQRRSRTDWRVNDPQVRDSEAIAWGGKLVVLRVGERWSSTQARISARADRASPAGF